MPSTRAAPFLQIGELKYGSRYWIASLPPNLAGRSGTSSIALARRYRQEQSLRGNLFEMFAYRLDSLEVRHRIKFEENDPYLRMVCDRWQEGLIQLVHDIRNSMFSSNELSRTRPTGANKDLRDYSAGRRSMAIDAGADALGFNFFRGSRRFIPDENLDSFPAGQAFRVAVVVNATAEELDGAARVRCFEAVQFHGTEPLSSARRSDFPLDSRRARARRAFARAGSSI